VSSTLRNDAEWGTRLARYRAVRAHSERLTAPLSPEDCQVQSMSDASPAKWHLGHTSWFFETFLLVGQLDDYRRFDPAYEVLFNSYYVGVGDRHPRPERGLLSRPSLDEIRAYRAHVDDGMGKLIGREFDQGVSDLIELGLQHEQQHQELILMDIKHVLASNPTDPIYAADAETLPSQAAGDGWYDHPGGLHVIGHDGPEFAFDNECPRHRIWLEPFRLGRRLVRCGDYLSFMEDRGYCRPELWLSDGWDAVVREGWQAPLYWRPEPNDGWSRFTLAGRRMVNPDDPVLHLSYYEADAYARWADARLPTEGEWEVAVLAGGLQESFATAWQWTASPYVPYPGFRPAAGAVGEYNGKFMINQMVLRGGSFATPTGHARTTYRNFFPPHARWMFGSLRLAKDVEERS